MLSIKTCLGSDNNAKRPPTYISGHPFRRFSRSSNINAFAKSNSPWNPKYNLIAKLLNASWGSSFRNLPQERQISLEALEQKAKQYISVIKDPLWKHVCNETLRMMGPSVFFKIHECQLESFNSTDKIIYMYCPSEEVAQFIQKYDFVILGSLQQFFPNFKELRIVRQLH